MAQDNDSDTRGGDAGGTRPWAGPAGRPDRIGLYRILDILGEGGMGTVYLAEQLQPLKRVVALKVIRAGMGSREVVARFEAERRALAVLDHPNIARVFDAGTTASGQPYFAMERVDGLPVSRFCDEHALSIRQRVELFLDICDAVQHAHHKGVIHRDLKPSNILVAGNGRPLPRVIDFGIAKAVGGGDDEPVTRMGELLGTPEYMSPEQAGLTDVDARTDVYSLGVVLYELIAGALPRRLTHLPDPAVRQALAETDPPTPSQRFDSLGEMRAEIAHRRRTEPGALRRQLAGDLGWIVMKALERDRNRRYDTPHALAADLRRHMHDQPVSARPITRLYLAGRFLRRNRLAVGAAAAILLALVAGAAAATLGLLRARDAERIALQEAEAAREVSDFLITLFQTSDPTEARGDTVTARALLERGAERIRGRLADQPLTRARLMTAMGTAYLLLGVHEPADSLLSAALGLRRAAPSGPNPDLALSLKYLADLRTQQARYDAADSLYRQALAALDSTAVAHMPQRVRALYGLGRMNVARGSLEEAESWIRPALAELDAGTEPDIEDLAPVVNGLGVVLMHLGRLDEAEPHLRRALEIRERLYGEDHYLVSQSLVNLAVLHMERDAIELAESALRRALAIKEATLEPDHIEVANVLNNLAVIRKSQGRIEEAMPLYERALSIYRTRFGPDHPEVATLYNNIGNVYFGEGDHAEAERFYRQAFAIYEARGEREWRNLAGLAELAAARDRLAAADSLYREAIAVATDRIGAAHPNVASLMEDRAEILRGLGRDAAADSLAATAAAIGER